MSKRLEGRVAVITGAGSGIGYATALRLASEGAKVVVADTNEESGNKVAKEVGGLFVKCDVTNEAAVANLYKVAFDTYNRIDIAFNNVSCKLIVGLSEGLVESWSISNFKILMFSS